MACFISKILRQTPRVLVSSIFKPAIISPSTGIMKNYVRLIQTGVTINMPQVQKPAPNFRGTAVIGDEFKEISLSDYKGQYVVLIFYPLDFTFVCPTELIAFNDRLEDFRKLDAQLIGISVDSHYTHLAWMNTAREHGGLGKLKYPLLSDLNKSISKDYNVLINESGIALRGLFIIDPNGKLRIMSVNDLPIGRSVDETLRLIEAIRFVEEHGEVCPANWRKGDKTIKPTPKESREYFKAVAKGNN